MLHKNVVQPAFLWEHTGIGTAIIRHLDVAFRFIVGAKTVVHISEIVDLINLIDAVFFCPVRMLRLVNGASFVHTLRKLADMKDAAADFGMAVVDIGAGQRLSCAVDLGQDDAAAVRHGKKQIVIWVDKAAIPLSVLVGVRDHAHDSDWFVHLASPRSFFLSARAFSCSATFCFAQSGSFSVSAMPSTSPMFQRHSSPEYNSRK